MLWAALLPCATPDPSSADARLPLATWALRFTPRVALQDEAVLMELASCLRLWGGFAALQTRLQAEAEALGAQAPAWAPTATAALALARAGQLGADERALPERLDPLPLAVLQAARVHAPLLQRLGCQRLGDVRRLPRAGLARRFDAALLAALDRAYGLRPEAHVWFAPPESFAAELHLPTRVEVASALLDGARRLLLPLCGWLAARHRGALALALHWVPEARRARERGDGGRLCVRTASACHDPEHLERLLAEHLRTQVLRAPVGSLGLTLLEDAALAPPEASLLPERAAPTEALPRVIERLAARLGASRVGRLQPCADHRPEHMQHWQPATTHAPRPAPLAPPAFGPQPTWLWPEPVRLDTRGPRPLYQGELTLLIGPHRVEGGWWDHRDTVAQPAVQRDYWVAWSPHAGLLWIYQERLAHDQVAWYLHGAFA